jgi:Flp pilus assembly protein TadG
MKRNGVINNIRRDEDGGFLGTAIFLGIVIAIMAVVVIDGISIYNSYRLVSDATKKAAEASAENYSSTRNETRAALAAENYCVEDGYVFVEFYVNRDFGNLFEVTCSTEADTYVFKHLPYLKDMVVQESTNSARPS